MGAFLKTCLSMLQIYLMFSSGMFIGAFYTKQHRNEDIQVQVMRRNCREVVNILESFNQASIRCSCIDDSQPCNKTSHNHFEYEDFHIIFYEILSEHIPRPLFMQLQRENTFLAPGFQTEERLGDLYVIGSNDDHVRDCFYEGRIVNDAKSTITMNICSGFHGIIRNETNEFILSPHWNFSMNEKHVLSRSFHYSLNDDRKIQMCPTSGKRNGRRIFHDYQFEFNGNDLQLVDKSKRVRRAHSEKRYLETMVVADQSLFEFYGRNEVQIRRYILSIMAIVTSLMKDGSIGNYIEVSVVKLIILKQNPSDLNITQDSSLSLRRFCKWQSKQNHPDDTSPEHFDTAILITRKNLCSLSNKCETLGLAELGSVCDTRRSCSVVEDNGLSVAFTIAHELGHLLNAPHDGDQNDCTVNNNKVHIMTPTFSIKYKKWTWSSCSRKFITEFVESTDASCLLDKPSPKFEHPLPLKLPGEMFSHDQQCQLVYGEDSLHCPFVNQCDRILCKRTRKGRSSCNTNNMPWADGTKCARNKWCVQGKCKRKEKLQPIHGNWGRWSGYNGCSRTCGGGVRRSTRKCDQPRPSFNGDYCIGPRHRFKSCNTLPCPHQHTSFRAMQCASFNGKHLDIPGVPKIVTWLPKYTHFPRDRCKLFCEIKGYGIFYQLRAKVIDGTKCRKGSTDICVDGLCKHAGCDNVLGSHATVDQCGVCNGDNSSCEVFTGSKRETHMGYNFVVHVPKGASRLKVIQTSSKAGTHDTNFLALINQKKRYVFNGQWRVSLGRRRYVSYRTNVFYSGPNEQNETIWIPGPLYAPVEVRVLSIGPSDNCNIWYTYTYPVQKKPRYTWMLEKKWSECFPACQGHQIREYVCRRNKDSKAVSRTKCPNKKPLAKSRQCNGKCFLRWKVVKLDCVPLLKCGSGVQQQRVTCTAVHKKMYKEIEIVLPNQQCTKAKISPIPSKEIPCYRPCSSFRWIYTKWNFCSEICGGGIQQREVTCIDQKNNKTSPRDSCNVAELKSLQRPCNQYECPKWFAGAWSAVCSSTCGKGVVERAVYCISNEERVNETFCDSTARPLQIRPCLLRSCASWKTKAWSKCSKECGVGFQNRDIFCETGVGGVVKDVNCNLYEKPDNHRKCFEKSCELTAKLAKGISSTREAKWLIGVWSNCSLPCGGGFRKRVVGCVVDDMITDDRHCNATKKPIQRESCNVFMCHAWRHGSWSECTKSCDKGIQKRHVECIFKGGIVSAVYCSNSTKPIQERSCNHHHCSTSATVHDEPSNWNVSKWSECSNTCGDGTQIRSVECIGQCDNKHNRPSNHQSCNNGNCPTWNYGQWTQCKNEHGCGQGWMVRLVVCQLDSGKVLSSAACDQRFKPVSNSTCQMVACRVKYKWITTQWHPCGPSCIQKRRVFCMQENEQVDDNLCGIAEKPYEEKRCSNKNCVANPVYLWREGEWGECSNTCGHSLRSRNVECVDEKHTVVNDSLCENEMPGMVDVCLKAPCPRWYAESWSECSKSCGTGIQRREIHCRDSTLGKILDNACGEEKMMTRTQTCKMTDCQLESRWVTGDWGECPTTCGRGLQKRKLSCVDSLNTTQAFNRCDKRHRPIVTKTCNASKCAWRSCRDVQRKLRVKLDGEHVLQVHNNKLNVYCEGMHRNNPKEFISLKSDSRENYSEIYGERLRDGSLCPNNGKRQIPCSNCIHYAASGVTFFKKIRIDIRRKTIIPEDKTFTDGYGKTRPGYATAGDCYSQSNCPQGRFMVNLKGTGIVIDSNVTWTSRGYHSSQKIRRLKGGEVIYGKCGGYCGMCSPTDRNGLKFRFSNLP